MTVKKKIKFEGPSFEGNVEELIVQSLIEKQGVDIQCINLKKVNNAYFDYFVICTGNSKPHVETLCDFVQETTMREAGLRPNHVEGLDNCEWVLLDYFNVVVHIFQPEARQYYNLEALWSDAEIQKF